MRFKDFLYEKKKVVEPSWADDYSSGYARLKDIQRACTEKNMATQLFVPKRRDPKRELERKRDRDWRDIKKQFPDEIKEESIPILTSFKESPWAGDSKPSGAFWTSSAIKSGDGYTSDWYRFVQKTFPEWQTDYGYLFEVDSSALVLGASHLDQFYEWAEFAHKFTKEVPDWAKNYWGTDQMRTNYPWDTMARHFDGVRHTYSYGSDSFTYGWDVESTAWFNTKVLKYKGAVKLTHSFDEDD
jgi:hypothetical protein